MATGRVGVGITIPALTPTPTPTTQPPYPNLNPNPTDFQNPNLYPTGNLEPVGIPAPPWPYLKIFKI